MNDNNSLAGSYDANNAPHGVTNARDQEYVAYSSLAGSIGHRLVYHDSSVSDEQYIAYTTTPDADYM